MLWIGTIVLLHLTSPVQASLDPSKAITQYIHKTWQADTGLPENSVTSIAQTPDGYLWMGTEAGLARFDGIKFTVYEKRNTPAIGSNFVTALLTDHTGALWIGSAGGGLAVMKDGLFKRVSGADFSETVTSFYEDRHGVLWIGTDGNGIVQCKKGVFRRFHTQDGLADNAVFSITGDDKGTVWVGTQSGLSRISGGHFTAFANQRAFDHLPIRALCMIDPEGFGSARTRTGFFSLMQTL